MAYEKTEQVGWNLSEALILEIANHLQAASRNFIQHNLHQTFFCLQTVKMRIIHNLKSDKGNNERKEFTDLEKKIFPRAMADKSEELRMSSIAWGRNRFELAVLITKYNELIMDKLEKYGYTIQKKVDRTKLIG